MQQTENLKLNLIETGDPISPAPINENAEKLEAKFTALDAADAAQESATDELATRVTALEVHKVAVGTYPGSRTQNTDVNLGFTPKAVFLYYMGSQTAGLFAEGAPLVQSGRILAKVIPGGFQVTTETGQFNFNGNHPFVALA